MTHRVRAAIRAIEYHLPEGRLTNADLAEVFPEWTAEKIRDKIGIDERRIAAPNEYASDLAVKAAARLFESGAVAPGEIDYLILCTQTADYHLPATACLVQDRLGLRKSCGALDFNLGCSGYVYGLGLAKGLIETGQAQQVLLLTADTLHRILGRKDKSVLTLFGDAATATLISGQEGHGTPSGALTGPFAYGTDGSGATHLFVPAGGMRHARDPNAPTEIDDNGNERTINDVHMNGPEVFAFTLREVPVVVDRVLTAAGLVIGDIDLFVLHQANAYALSHLQRKLQIAPDRFIIDMADCGNTASSSIPIVLQRAIGRGALRPGMRVMVVGFGIGFSWGAALLSWD